MTSARGGRLEWHGGHASPAYHPAYDSSPYQHHEGPRGPPAPRFAGYPPHSTGPPPPGHPSSTRYQDQWFERQQEQQHRRVWYGPPRTEGNYERGPPPPPGMHYGEARQGPPPTPHGPPHGYPEGRMPPSKSPYPPHEAAYYYRRGSPGDPAMMYPPHMMQQQHHQTLRRDDMMQTEPASSKEEDSPEENETQGGDRETEERKQSNEEKEEEKADGTQKKKKGDPLALLAKVSSTMEPPKEKKAAADRQENKEKMSVVVTSPAKGAPNSPLQRRLRSSPIITPNSGQPHTEKLVPPYARQGPPLAGPSNTLTPKPITPTGANYYGPPPPPHVYEEGRGGPPAYPPYGMPPRGNYPPGSYPSGYDSRSGSWEQRASPVIVEDRNTSFDSVDSAGSLLRHPDHYARSRYYGGGSSPYQQPESWHPDQQRSFPPPPPPRWGYDGPPPRYPPSQQQQHRGPYPPPPPQYYTDERGYRASPMHAGYAPYSYVQQPGIEEKTVLRKKFSWKHYPELERFLIDNRDEYLKFSSRNYTVEQKQFNNMLTEQLIALAEKNGYVFDPDDFNFVAIRDRIRCYYKSYVQTARKRGMQLPIDKVREEKRREAEAKQEIFRKSEGSEEAREENTEAKEERE